MDSINISLKNNCFVNIVDEYGNSYYGGNQAWFEQSAARASACGTVCAANICAYMSKTQPKYYNLYKYDSNYSKDYYLRHMNEVYNYISPIVLFKLPKFFRDKKILGFYLKEDLNFGIPSVGYFSKEFKKFARTRGVMLRKKVFKRGWSRAKARGFIREALENDKPVALLNLFNSKLKRIETISCSGERFYGSYDQHWVTITGMTIDKNTGKVYLEVSSWGCKAKLDLDDVVSGFSKAMVYFE